MTIPSRILDHEFVYVHHMIGIVCELHRRCEILQQHTGLHSNRESIDW